MKKQLTIYKGAEAEINIDRFLEFKVVKKRRISKGYRIKQIDELLIAARTKEEAKLIIESRKCGVPVPIIYDVNLKQGVITMEYLRGDRIKDILNKMSHEKRKNICLEIGKNIARLHNNDIIHGDITTSNMIKINDMVYFIDFGLGEKNSEIEAKGVDLHVLMEALESTHSQYSNCFKYVLQGYQKEIKKDYKLIAKKIDEIVKRGRYR